MLSSGAGVSAGTPLVAELAQGYIEEEAESAGLSIGIIRDGRIETWHFGNADGRGGAPGDATRYEVGSITKTMTGLILARAVAEGHLRLEDDVRLHLQGDYPKLEYEGAPVRVFHLANMTSALPDNLPDLPGNEPDPGRFQRAAILAGYGKADFLRDLHEFAPSATPGESVAHSNLAAQLLIYVLEHATGLEYEALLAREIEGPLGIDRSEPSVLPGFDGEGNAAAATPVAQFGWRYSISDMLRYAALQLDEGDAAVHASHQPSWFTLDRSMGVAMPWIVTFLPEGGRRLHYSGGTWGFSSYMALYPERNLGIVVLSNNTSDTAQRRLGEIAGRIAAAQE
jgi:CubicO group peptidase (beta-lactamase class C family)